MPGRRAVEMDLTEALRTTGSVRAFTRQPVIDEIVWSILDDARFAPSGGNRQGVARHLWSRTKRRARRFAISTSTRGTTTWAIFFAGLIPFSPLASDEDRAAALAQRGAAEAMSGPTDSPRPLNEVPVMLVICADLNVLAATDRDLDRYSIVGGASI